MKTREFLKYANICPGGGTGGVLGGVPWEKLAPTRVFKRDGVIGDLQAVRPGKPGVYMIYTLGLTSGRVGGGLFQRGLRAVPRRGEGYPLGSIFSWVFRLKPGKK